MKKYLILLCIILFAAVLRSYTVSAGLPYFYDEDEAHHFNRTVNMAKSGDMNPYYFHKPSLHFYLRIPLVWLGSYLGEKKGHFNEIPEVRTYNKFGIADYAFTASHPGIVKWLRSESLAWSLIIVLLTFLTAEALTGSLLCGAFSAAAVSISPPLISYSSIIGVDILMTMMCLLSVYSAVLYGKSKKTYLLVLSAIFSGLAVSSKYNALPVCAVPLLACLLNKSWRKKDILICIFIPVVSFFAASPYILISLPEFIKDLSYEVWHYSTAGHEGHSANPGIEQMLFYFNWFYKDALGAGFSLLAIAGLIVSLFKIKDRTFLIFLTFPLLYFLMMVLQKANFVRNMLVIVPFLFIFAGLAVQKISETLKIKKPYELVIFLALFFIGGFKPLSLSLAERSLALSAPESRDELTAWILSNVNQKETAVSGQLQLIPQIPLTLKNYTTFDEEMSAPEELWLDGYDLVISKSIPENIPQLEKVKSFPGNTEAQRIVKNPQIEVYQLKKLPELTPKFKAKLDLCTECNFTCKPKESFYLCGSESGSETYHWIQKRLSQIEIPGLSEALSKQHKVEVEAEILSPWDNRLSIFPKGEEQDIKAGRDFQKLKFSLTSELVSEDKLILYTEVIKSPFKQQLSNDKRRLGVALRKLSIR